MSTPSPIRVQSGVPNGGQFAPSSRGEADVSLPPAGEPAPTDPIALIAFHDRQRAGEQAELDALWNAGGEYDEYDSVKDGAAQMELQRYAQLAAAVSNAPAPAPVVVTQVIGTEQAIKDRNALDVIACTLGQSSEWDVGYVGAIADTIGRTGRPHPGKPALTDKEVAAIEADDEVDIDDAYAEAYRAKLLGSRDPGPAKIKFDGAETRITGSFGEVIISERDGEPGTIVMVDSSAATDGQPLVVMINDDVHEIAPEIGPSAEATDPTAEYESATQAYASLMDRPDYDPATEVERARAGDRYRTALAAARAAEAEKGNS